jgi:hypothetical protein
VRAENNYEWDFIAQGILQFWPRIKSGDLSNIGSIL